MNLTLADIQSFHPANNRVVLKAAVDTSKFTYGSTEFYSPLSMADGKPYDAAKSQPIICTVVSVPRKLIFGKRKVFHESVEELEMPPQAKQYLKAARQQAQFTEVTTIEVPIPGSMMWRTPIEVKPGDIVWVNSNHLANAEKQGNTLIADGQLYYVLPYESLYLKKSGDSVAMLNGWMLCELIEDTPQWHVRAEKMGMFIPGIMKQIPYNDRLGVVKYIGSPVEYLFPDRYDFPEIKVGDVVMFRFKINRRLEPGAKYFAKDGADLIVSRRANILSIMQ